MLNNPFLIKTSRLLEKLSQLDGLPVDTSIKALEILVFVAMHGPCNQIDICEALNITPASASRILAFWSTVGTKRDNKRGAAMDMISRVPDIDDRRKLVITLSAKGLEFFKEFSA